MEVVRYLPKHCSWLNQIEIVFGIAVRKVICRGNFLSVTDLEQRLKDFLDYFNFSRKVINAHVGRIKRIFRWAVENELVSSEVYHALLAVQGLQRNRCVAREMAPIIPVSQYVVEQTLPFLPPAIADIVRFQRLTGARPAEACIVRPCDVDVSDEVWLYRPESHKSEHHDRNRMVFVGPRAQEILRPYLIRNSTAYCFSPAESERHRSIRRRAARKTPLTPSQVLREAKANE